MTKTKRIALMVASAFSVVVVGAYTVHSVSAGTDDYPSDLKDRDMDTLPFDPWGFYNRNCTSFVAWRMVNNNGFKEFNNYITGKGDKRLGSATYWGDRARAAGYTVDDKPAKGAVVWWPAGHVAWVESVDAANSKVTIEEYNRSLRDPGKYGSRTIATKGLKFIHFTKDIPTGSANTSKTKPDTANSLDMAGNPSAVTRSPSSMDVFYRTTGGKLINKGWDASRGWWVNQTLADNIAGDPVAVLRGSGNMEVFYRTSKGSIANVGWGASTGWHASQEIVSSGAVGNPSALARTTDSMDLFLRTNGNELKNYSWSAAKGWYGNQTINSNVTGSPIAVMRGGPNYMNVYFRQGSGDLGSSWWEASSGWHQQSWSASMVGDPQAIARSSGNLDVFYRKDNDYIVNRYWDVKTGWHIQDWPGALSGNPSAIARTPGNMDVLYREHSGNIKERWWDAKVGWVSSKDYATDAAGDPVVISRAGDNLEVFYRDNKNVLRNIHWSASTGWHNPTTP